MGGFDSRTNPFKGEGIDNNQKEHSENTNSSESNEINSGPNKDEDPLKDMIGPMTRSRRLKMQGALANLIYKSWAKEECKSDLFKPNFVHCLEISMDGLPKLKPNTK